MICNNDTRIFSCAGHSLGAHVCSYAAKYAKSEFGITLRRVTGMDAAGPLFERVSAEVRKELIYKVLTGTVIS